MISNGFSPAWTISGFTTASQQANKLFPVSPRCAEIDSDGLDAVFYVFCGPGKTAAGLWGSASAVRFDFWRETVCT